MTPRAEKSTFTFQEERVAFEESRFVEVRPFERSPISLTRKLEVNGKGFTKIQFISSTYISTNKY